jgi:hypothetical protein
MFENGKAKIDKSFNGLSIIIPTKKNWFTLLFMTTWMVGWFFGYITAAGILFSGEAGKSGDDSFLYKWLFFWTVAGLVVTTILLWGYFGQEKFIMGQGEVLFEKTVFGIGQKKRLQLSEIKNFRAEFGSNNWLGRKRSVFSGFGPGKIKFDYGYKTYSFGLAVDDAEATYIVGLLKEYFKE